MSEGVADGRHLSLIDELWAENRPQSRERVADGGVAERAARRLDAAMTLWRHNVVAEQG